MPRYVALLRGVSPMNLRMPDLKAALEDTGFMNVKTLLSSGNVAFDARKASEEHLQKKVEKAVTGKTGKRFLVVVRAQEDLRALIEADGFAKFALKKDEKRVVGFLRDAPAKKLALPIEKEGGRVLALQGREIYMAYVPANPKGAAVMGVLERALGKAQTSRTWDTVRKCAEA